MEHILINIEEIYKKIREQKSKKLAERIIKCVSLRIACKENIYNKSRISKELGLDRKTITDRIYDYKTFFKTHPFKSIEKDSDLSEIKKIIEQDSDFDFDKEKYLLLYAFYDTTQKTNIKKLEDSLWAMLLYYHIYLNGRTIIVKNNELMDELSCSYDTLNKAKKLLKNKKFLNLETQYENPVLALSERDTLSHMNYEGREASAKYLSTKTISLKFKKILEQEETETIGQKQTLRHTQYVFRRLQHPQCIGVKYSCDLYNLKISYSDYINIQNYRKAVGA